MSLPPPPSFKHEVMSGMSDDQFNLPRPTRQPVVRSRANITSACLACKKRKRKCLGGLPCPHCESLNISCIYDEKLDKRRKAFNEKARAEVDFQTRLLEGLLKAIKSDRATDVLELVRQGASQNDIASKLESLSMFQSSPADYLSHDAGSPGVLDDHLAGSPGGSYPEPRSLVSNGESDSLRRLCSNRLLSPQNTTSQHYPALQGNSIPSISEIFGVQQDRESAGNPSPTDPPPHYYYQRYGDPNCSKNPAHHDSRAWSLDPFRSSIHTSDSSTPFKRHSPGSNIDRLLNQPLTQ